MNCKSIKKAFCNASETIANKTMESLSNCHYFLARIGCEIVIYDFKFIAKNYNN
ncbi:hypothetical protein [Brachyspira sp.]|uniref:hypothetical protein n=1 Tax=Brachyspira sp. TaxID=1977261 RepID=UPI003D7D5CF3